jgi:hypothetical protein
VAVATIFCPPAYTFTSWLLMLRKVSVTLCQRGFFCVKSGVIFGAIYS